MAIRWGPRTVFRTEARRCFPTQCFANYSGTIRFSQKSRRSKACPLPCMAVLREGRNWRKCKFGWFRGAISQYWGWCRNKAVCSPTRTTKYRVAIPSRSPATLGGPSDSQTNHSPSEKQLRSVRPFTALLVSPRANSLARRLVSRRISGFHSRWRHRFLRDGTD